MFDRLLQVLTAGKAEDRLCLETAQQAHYKNAAARDHEHARALATLQGQCDDKEAEAQDWKLRACGLEAKLRELHALTRAVVGGGGGGGGGRRRGLDAADLDQPSVE